jgi:hypothetical protein
MTMTEIGRYGLGTTKETKVCSICQQPYSGYGNNAWPVNDGRCCDDCNSSIVIPARLVEFTHRKEK